MKEKIGYIILPVITLVYLLINFYMVKHNITLCQTDGCSLTKSFLKIDVSLLYTLSIIVYIFMIISYLLNLRSIFKLFLFNVFVAESILIFLFYKQTGEVCLVCLCFYSLILINLLFLLFSNKKEYFSITLLLVSLIINFIILETKILPNKINNNILIEPISKKYVIIGSETCSFCNKLKSKMNELNIEYEVRDYHNYENTLKLLNIKNIPVLLIKDDETNFRLIYGEETISKEMFKTSNKNIEKESSSTKDNSQDVFLNQFLTKDGCSIIENNKENCE